MKRSTPVSLSDRGRAREAVDADAVWKWGDFSNAVIVLSFRLKKSVY
jgi:hypothetical protein